LSMNKLRDAHGWEEMRKREKVVQNSGPDQKIRLEDRDKHL